MVIREPHVQIMQHMHTHRHTHMLVIGRVEAKKLLSLVEGNQTINTYLHLWYRFTSQHGFIHNKWSSQQQHITRNRIIILRTIYRTDVSWYQLIAQDWTPLTIAVHLKRGNTRFVDIKWRINQQLLNFPVLAKNGMLQNILVYPTIGIMHYHNGKSKLLPTNTVRTNVIRISSLVA